MYFLNQNLNKIKHNLHSNIANLGFPAAVSTLLGIRLGFQHICAEGSRVRNTYCCLLVTYYQGLPSFIYILRLYNAVVFHQYLLVFHQYLLVFHQYLLVLHQYLLVFHQYLLFSLRRSCTYKTLDRQN